MSDIERAITQIADIRAQLAASTRYRGYAPEAVGLLALLSLVVMALQLGWPERFAANDRQIVIAWAMALGGGWLLIAVEAVARSLRGGGGLGDPQLRAAIRATLPGAVVVAVVPAAVLSQQPQASWIIPGVWQMVTGMVAFASYAIMPRAIVWPAAWFMACGAGSLLLAGQAGGLSPLVVGLPFLAGHLGIALVLAERGGAGHAR